MNCKKSEATWADLGGDFAEAQVALGPMERQGYAAARRWCTLAFPATP